MAATFLKVPLFFTSLTEEARAVSVVPMAPSAQKGCFFSRLKGFVKSMSVDLNEAAL